MKTVSRLWISKETKTKTRKIYTVDFATNGAIIVWTMGRYLPWWDGHSFAGNIWQPGIKLMSVVPQNHDVTAR